MTHAHDQDLHHSESNHGPDLSESSTPLNIDTNTSTQIEIGKSFASKRIQVAPLALRSSAFGSMSGGMSPLFPTSPIMAQHSSPFVVSSFSGSSPTTSSLFGLADHDRALLDKTWSVLAPKLESNQQHRTTKSRRRRVTFNDVVEFFELPPPYDQEDQEMEHDDLDTLSTGAKGGKLTTDNENEGCEGNTDNSTTIGGSDSPSLMEQPQLVNNSLIPTFDITNESSQHINNNNNISNIPSSPTDTRSPASSRSISSIFSSSSSLSSSSIEYSSNKINAFRSPLFNQKINASNCSLPIFQAPSSVVSLVSPPSSLSPTTTVQPSNTNAFRAKGNKISKYTILDILEKRPQHHSIPHELPTRRTTNSRFSTSQAPPGFHKTLDAVQNEIKQAIERAKATPTANNQRQQQQYQLDEQLQGTSDQQQELLTSFSNDTLSSTTTLVDGATCLHSDNNYQQIGDDLMEFSSSTSTDNDVQDSQELTTEVDTAPSDTSMDGFGENILNAFDRIMVGDSINSDQIDKPMDDGGDKITKQEEWVKENTDDDQRPIHSSRIWHVLDSSEDALSSMKKPSPNDTNNVPDSNTGKNGRLYLKVIAAENLDFPIDNDAPGIRCSVINENKRLESGYYSMKHDIHFNYEYIVDDVFPEAELTVTLQVSQPPDANTKRWSKRTSWTDRKSGSDLARYIHPDDRSLAQTRISFPSIAPQCRTTLCTASFALVNGWYRPAKKSTTTRMAVQEKAVGKIIIELFYLPNVHSQMSNLPINMDACENALNIQKFHQMDWCAGYMSQLGGDVKFWRRRYFKLVGSRLYSYTDTMHSPRTWIDLSQVVELVCDHRILVTTDNNSNDTPYPDVEATTLAMALESFGCSSSTSISSISSNNDFSMTFDDSTTSISTSTTSLCTITTSNSQDDLSCYSVKNGFHLKFKNGDKIDFFCDSAGERDQWLHVLKLILGRIPTLPTWLSCIV